MNKIEFSISMSDVEVEILRSCDNYKIVGYFVKQHVNKQDFFDGVLMYDADPDEIEENFDLEDIKHGYWRVVDQSSDSCDIDYGDDLDLEIYAQSDKDNGFPVTYLYIDSRFEIV